MSLYHVMKLLSPLEQVSLLAKNTKRSKKLSQVVLIGDFEYKMFAYSYLEQNEIKENVIVCVCAR